MTTNAMAVPMMRRLMAGTTMNALEFLGLCFITSMLGGSEARAPAAKVSMIRFTHSICVTVMGNSEPNIEPSSTMTSAATLMVSWNRMNRWMFW